MNQYDFCQIPDKECLSNYAVSQTIWLNYNFVTQLCVLLRLLRCNFCRTIEIDKEPAMFNSSLLPHNFWTIMIPDIFISQSSIPGPVSSTFRRLSNILSGLCSILFVDINSPLIKHGFSFKLSIRMQLQVRYFNVLGNPNQSMSVTE